MRSSDRSADLALCRRAHRNGSGADRTTCRSGAGRWSARLAPRL